MAEKRKNRQTPELQSIDKLEPIDVSILGTDEDPCFGKLYDLTTEECHRCGDSEFCAIKMAQTMKLKRGEIESKQKFLDIDEEVKTDDLIENLNDIKKMMRKKKRLGKSYLLIKKSILKKYPEVDPKELKEIYNNLK